MVLKLKITLYEADKGPRTILSDLTSGDRLLIGRGQSVQVWINDKNISREHCAISCQNDQVLIEDLNSRNGTFVNAQRILQLSPMADGDQVKLASNQLLHYFFRESSARIKPGTTRAVEVIDAASVQPRIGRADYPGANRGRASATQTATQRRILSCR